MGATPERFAGFRPAGATESAAGNRAWWDAAAAGYLSEHGEFLAGQLVWGPEGLTEQEAGLLGDVTGRNVLEVGAGAAQCATWLASQGARVVALDLSMAMLRGGPARPESLPAAPRSTDSRSGPTALSAAASAGSAEARTAADANALTAARRPAAVPRPPAVHRLQADARALPLADSSFDLAFSSFGALPFVADPERVHAGVARVLRPGGRWVFSLTHPIRWAFPDDPGPRGLRVTRSYFDRTPYVEAGPGGTIEYAEHHRTVGDRIRELVAAGFRVLDLVEPQWPADLDQVWGGWSPRRGRLIPGTAIFVSELPG